jgi:hypothetical protein
MSDLIYPNLFLFLYDLRSGLGENPEALAKNQALFAAKFPEHLRSSLFNHDTAFETEYSELIANQYETFPDTDKPLEGYSYPVRLNDIYSLLIACSFPQDTTPHPTNCIAQLKTKIEEKLNNSPPTLGQTWLIFAQLANPNSHPKTIAQTCCQSLNLNVDWKRDVQGQGRLFGGTLFELWHYQLQIPKLQPDIPAAPTLEQIQQSQHIIIALFPDAKAAQKAATLQFNWLRLFSYRHKILWAYAQSRYLKQQLEENFTQIKHVSALDLQKVNLKELRQSVINAQNNLSNYTINLNYFAYQIRTLEINLLNYNTRLNTITNHLVETQAQMGEDTIKTVIPEPIVNWMQSSKNRSSDPDTDPSYLFTQLGSLQNPSDLKFLEQFSENQANKYLLQLQKDYENLSPGISLLENFINSSRTITEIDQAQRDRTFQNTVAIVGVGLAAGSMVVSLNKLGEGKNDPVRSVLTHSLKIQPPWLEPAIPLVYSLSTAILAALLTWLVIRLKDRARV